MKKLIYLEDAIEAIKDADVLVFYNMGTDTDDVCELAIRSTKCSVIESLKDLPSAKPERKTGRWIPVTNGRGGHECDQCHEYAPSWATGEEHLTKYCPNCGGAVQRDCFIFYIERWEGGRLMAKKYVEAETIRAKMMYYGFRAPDMTVTEFVDDLPYADVVEVVRCGQCKYRDEDNGFCYGRGFPNQLVAENGFCDKGERKE